MSTSEPSGSGARGKRFENGEVDIDPDDDVLAAQLWAIKWKLTSRGQIEIESMDEIRKRGLPSPDRADGLGLRLRLPGRACSPRRVAPGPEHHRGSDVEGPVTPRRVEDRVISTVDPDAWHGHKTAAHRVRWLQGPDQARAAAPNTAEYSPNMTHARGNRALVIGHRLVTHAAERAGIDPHHLTSSGASAQLRQAVAALG